ncbi:carbohydrate ABC transporter permease [Bacillota bacterium Meth-B3]|nr:carbohydrate ABC transporter permease [Christensenellaceae bacterium]MEA5064939.1 carbohydrate ABC transporter permease [Eubacteriales bacterium]MEA5069341.1 carbohydrate ABC transporter permease [Christensenellaceae bacterium]
MCYKRASKPGLALRYALFILVLLFTVFPIYWIVSCSFRETDEIQRVTISVLQKTFTSAHYVDAFTKIGLWTSLGNSAVITLGTVLITIPIGLLGGYAFSRRAFRGRHFMHSLVMLTQFIPVVAYIVPLYLVMSRLRLLKTIYSLLITYLATAYPMATILLIGYVQDVPDSLEEAALIDGCGPLQAMLRIVFPLAIPGIITSAVFVFISIWQEYFIAMSFVSKDSARTVSMAMKKFVSAHGADWGGIMAASVISTIPVVTLFVLFRKKLTDNLAGGIKG